MRTVELAETPTRAPSGGGRSAPSRSAQRRTAILEGTLRLIAEGGVDAVTHRRVAAEAGVSLSSTTYYFDRREDIIREAFLHQISKPTPTPTDPRELDPSGPAEVIDLLVEWVEAQLEHPTRLLAEYELMLYTARDPELAPALEASQQSEELRLAAGLEKLGAPRPLDSARLLSGLVRAFEIESITRPSVGIDDFRRRLEILVPALLGDADRINPSSPNGEPMEDPSQEIRRNS